MESSASLDYYSIPCTYTSGNYNFDDTSSMTDLISNDRMKEEYSKLCLAKQSLNNKYINLCGISPNSPTYSDRVKRYNKEVERYILKVKKFKQEFNDLIGV